MSGFTTIVIAFMLALVVATIGWAGPAVVFAIPVAIVGIGIALVTDFSRRRKNTQLLEDQRRRAKTDDVQFTERDRETLVSD
jgi:uncharacterized membrane protein